MSETPEEERPVETTAAQPAQPAPPRVAPAPVQQPVEPMHRRRSVQLVAVGLIGLLLGGLIGLSIGLTAGFAFGDHHRGRESPRYQQYGPGYHQPGRHVPQGPFAPPAHKRPFQPNQPGQTSPAPSAPGPQAS